MKQRRSNQASWGRGWLVSAVVAVVPAAFAQAPRFSVSSEQVVAAMQGHAWPIEGVRVTLPASITATVADPKLGIQTASMLTAHEARLRIVCRVPAACLPFFATAVWPEGAEPVSPPSGQSTARTARSTPASSDSKTEVHEASPDRLRAGAPVVLVLEGERIHIRLHAVSLQGGAAGDTVRVASRDHKQTYVAEIVTPTLLKGSLSQ